MSDIGTKAVYSFVSTLLLHRTQCGQAIVVIYTRARYIILGIYEIWHHRDSLSHLQTTKHLMLDFCSPFQQTFRMPLYEREYNVPIRKSMQNDANRSEYYSFNNQSLKHRCFIRINKSYNITNFFHVFYLSFG